MPTKVTYLEFEDNPELEFEFFLTQKLGLGTVANMRAKMSQPEFMQWSMFYQRKAQRMELETMKMKAGG